MCPEKCKNEVSCSDKKKDEIEIKKMNIPFFANLETPIPEH